MAAAEKMHVQVIDRLAAVRPDIRNHAVAAVGDAEVNSNLGGSAHDLSEQFGVGFGGCGNVCYVALRHDQHVDGSLRNQIVEGKQLFVFIYRVRRNLTARRLFVLPI